MSDNSNGMQCLLLTSSQFCNAIVLCQISDTCTIFFKWQKLACVKKYK